MRHMGVAALYPKRRTSAPGRGHKGLPLPAHGRLGRTGEPGLGDGHLLSAHGQGVHVPGRGDGTGCLAGCSPGGYRTPWTASSASRRSRRRWLATGAPEIFNTDQGAQFTSEAFTDVLKAHGVAISMDGKGRWIDNVFIERLWRSVKYEDIYLRAYETPAALRAGLTRYFDFYNTRRRHTALDRRTPDAVYFRAGRGEHGGLKPGGDFT